ncbi:hypothetical protein [Streptomyces sp. NPDC054783]
MRTVCAFFRRRHDHVPVKEFHDRLYGRVRDRLYGRVRERLGRDAEPTAG